MTITIQQSKPITIPKAKPWQPTNGSGSVVVVDKNATPIKLEPGSGTIKLNSKKRNWYL